MGSAIKKVLSRAGGFRSPFGSLKQDPEDALDTGRIYPRYWPDPPPSPQSKAAQRRHLRTQRRDNGRRRFRPRAVRYIYMASFRLIRNMDEIPSSL
jgi:hypothetical protein